MRLFVLSLACAVTWLLTGCYIFRPSSGGGQIAETAQKRFVDPSDVAVPLGYSIRAITGSLTFPTGAAFDAQGNLHVVESGYAYGEVWTVPRLLRLDASGNASVIATGGTNGPWTGVAFHDGAFFVAEGGTGHGGRILRIHSDGVIQPIVEGLPSFGDHHTDGPAIGADGWIYFGQGTASNSGIVGEDNARFGWLLRHPEFHDIPGADITLVGQSFQTRDVFNTNSQKHVATGAFLPFGVAAQSNQVIKGQVKCSGAILRVRPNGSELQLVAWGFRNPFGLAFAPGGDLYVTDNGYDERGSRPIWGAPDVLWRVQQGLWYGWPDFSAGEPVNTKHFTAPGKPRPEFLLARHPNTPPKPVTTFGVHSSANGFDFSRSDRFGYVGHAFVALFGDESPATGKTLHPVGFKVVRVDMKRGTVEDFAVNYGTQNGPASRLQRGGLERPVSVRFSPDGADLYVVDFGIMRHDKAGAYPQQGSGVIWKISRGRQQR